MTPQNIQLILATNNQSVSFDGQTYTITDVNGTVSTFMSGDLQTFMQGLQSSVTAQKSYFTAMDTFLTSLQTFITANPVAQTSPPISGAQQADSQPTTA